MTAKLTSEGWKVKTSDKDYERTGRRYWQRILPVTNQYVDIIFKNEVKANEFIDNHK